MIIALAVQNESLAATLGSSEKIVLFQDCERIGEIPCSGNTALLLKKHNAGLLICSGIGNCMMDLLLSMQIQVIPGVSGSVTKVMEQYFSGTLKAGKNYSCADHGRTCGECPGTF